MAGGDRTAGARVLPPAGAEPEVDFALATAPVTPSPPEPPPPAPPTTAAPQPTTRTLAFTGGA